MTDLSAPQTITPAQSWPLHGAQATRQIELAALAHLAPGTLMQRAGLAVARLALALAPHARTVWVACGPGNNGGDGLEAAVHLRAWGKRVCVTWLGDEARLPPDTLAALHRARAADLQWLPAPPDGLGTQDLCIDALLGIGLTNRLPSDPMREAIRGLNASRATVLAVDLPSGLSADTGQYAMQSIAAPAISTRAGGTFDSQAFQVVAQHTLSLLTLKPGLFTAHGRDAAGQVWWDALGVVTSATPPTAWLTGPPEPVARPHASHKGSYGDVAVIGGAPGMTGAALLAARAALHAGAGRVFVGLLDNSALSVDPQQPELMLRGWQSLDLTDMAVACGCGAGGAVRTVLSRVLATAKALVLDADALNAIAADTALQTQLQARARRHLNSTVLTPHPLEAARLLASVRQTACTAADVQADRLDSAKQLADHFACTVLLKGSGTVIAAPDHTPHINPTGNARLATAGTGDVLAGWLAAVLAAQPQYDAFAAACNAAFMHGLAAETWPAHAPLSASSLMPWCRYSG